MMESRQNGRSGNLSVSLDRSTQRRILVLPDTVSVAGQPDFKARDNSAEISSALELVSPETTAPTAKPASSWPFGLLRRKHSFFGVSPELLSF
jgi:hypothetical protein